MESDTKYERIGGTSMGGGTFWGLGSILTKANVRLSFQLYFLLDVEIPRNSSEFNFIYMHVGFRGLTSYWGWLRREITGV